MPATVDAPNPSAPPRTEGESPLTWAELESWFVELDRIRAERPLPPTLDADRLADMNWFFEQLNAGALDRYLRRFIAIRCKQVVAASHDRTWLELTLARQHPDTNPDCFHISFVD